MNEHIIRDKRELKEWLDAEQKYYGNNGIILYLKYLAGSEEGVIWRYQKRLRITEYHKNTHHSIFSVISRIRLNHLSNKTGFHISTNVCGKGLHIMHIGSILTNPNTVIGCNVAIHINTAFVAQGHNSDSPVIGNNVVVGTGATIVGGVNIADGIAIGANALVNKSFYEENIAIAGVPAKKISNNGRKTWNKEFSQKDSGLVQSEQHKAE